VRSGNLGRAMDSALARAAELRTVTPLASTVVLLRSENPAYEPAAREIARVLHGSVVVTDPKRLAFELLVRFSGTSVTERVPRLQAPEPPSTRSGPSTPTPPTGDSARDRRKARRAARGSGTVPSGGA
jgi:hypothetical protein